jgi:hypothetical protein
MGKAVFRELFTIQSEHKDIFVTISEIRTILHQFGNQTYGK